LRVSNWLRDKADIVCLQETKLKGFSSNIICSLWGRSCGLVLLGFYWGLRGILIMWDNRVVEKVECVGAYSLVVTFRNVVDRAVWAIAGVYGPNSDRDRRLLWDELAGVLSLWNLPCCLGGDFNVTRFPSEGSGSARLDHAMMEFSDFISEQGLMDLPLAALGGGGLSCFPRGAPGVMQKRLPRLCSDHFPILLDMGDVSRGRRPFKFENMWLKVEGFVDLVKQWWESYFFQGMPSFVFARKLKALKLDLKRWNEEKFDNIGRNKRILLNDLRGFDAHEESRALEEVELARKVEVVRELEKCALMEEVSRRQKSRLLWLKEGNKCTKFFHSIANSNRRLMLLIHL
jgi:hypothetical protein